MPSEYTLSDLAKLSGVSARTVRYYIQSGLLPAPTGAGTAARYSEAHLDRLRLIRKLQSGHLPLGEIRRRLEAMPDERIAAVAEAVADRTPADSALDYVSSLLSRDQEPAFAIPVAPSATLYRPAVAAAGPPPAAGLQPAASAPPAPANVPAAAPAPAHANQAPSEPAREPDRAQWERILLDPDIEIHIRRPLSRPQNKRVERLISIARQLLEED